MIPHISSQLICKVNFYQLNVFVAFIVVTKKWGVLNSWTHFSAISLFSLYPFDFYIVFFFFFWLINNNISKKKSQVHRECTWKDLHQDWKLQWSSITKILEQEKEEKASRTPSKQRVKEERFNLKSQPFCFLKA